MVISMWDEVACAVSEFHIILEEYKELSMVDDINTIKIMHVKNSYSQFSFNVIIILDIIP